VPSDEVLFDLVGDAHVVLLGEASHGTRDFYAARAEITRRLIEERILCGGGRGDCPDAYRVNRYVYGRSEDATAGEALRGFERFPTWMWRNAVVLDFVGWLRDHNGQPPAGSSTSVSSCANVTALTAATWVSPPTAGP
jgi:erythromycin esterase-like protein